MARGPGAGGRERKGAGGRGGSEKAEEAKAQFLDGLFRASLSEFTAARNALATQLKKAGRSADAARVKALPKPSVSAWAVNQLYWRHRKEFDRLLQTGDAFRTAQAAQLSGAHVDVRGPLEARREALSRLAQLAVAILSESDHAASPEMMRRVTSTLEALATYGTSANAPTPGHLIDDVEPPGFETLAALVPRVGHEAKSSTEPTRVLPFPHERPRPKGHARKTSGEQDATRAAEERMAQLAAARRAVTEAEQALARAKTTAERSEGALKAAAARVKDTEHARAAAEKVFEEATAAADAAKQEARRIATDAEDAAQAVEDAERDLDRARREVKSLE